MNELETKLAEALREIVDAADGTGWNQMDAGFSKAREALRLHAEVERLSAPLAATPAPAEPVAWGMRDKTTGLILDVICPDEHESFEGDYTVPLFAAPVAATPAAAQQWQPIETAPKDQSEFLLGVWEGSWGNPRKRFNVYQARGYPGGPAWSATYRTEEGEAYEIAGWMPLPAAPEAGLK